MPDETVTLKRELAETRARIAALKAVPVRKEPETAEELRAELDRALAEEAAQETARLLQFKDAATAAHSAFCYSSHIDMCGWQYENDTDWLVDFKAHKSWLERVSKSAAASKLSPAEAGALLRSVQMLNLDQNQYNFLRALLAGPCRECSDRGYAERMAARKTIDKL